MTSRYSSLSTDSTNSLIADRNKSRSESARSSSIFDNSGFNGICDDTNQLFENDSILQSWVRFKENVKKRMEETKDEINERRRIVESSIIEYTNALQNKVDEYGNDCIKVSVHKYTLNSNNLLNLLIYLFKLFSTPLITFILDIFNLLGSGKYNQDLRI